MTRQCVVLVHSGGFTSRQWRKLVDALAPRYDVLAPDLLGYGANDRWPDGEPFHFQQDVAYLSSLIETRGGEPVHLVGHSYGGFLALQLALARPELVRSLALYEPVAFSILDPVEDADARAALSLVKRSWEPDESGADTQWLEGFIDWWNGAGAWLRLPEETRGAFQAMGWKVFQEVLSLADATTSLTAYATIAVPTLVLGGEGSPLTERRVVEKLGATLPHARAQFFPGVGHTGPISHASLVNPAIVAHIDAAAGGEG